MTNEFVREHQGGLNFAFALSEKFLSICPDAVWQKNFGGWAVSRQFYHALEATSFFAASVWGGEIANPCSGAGDLSQKSGTEASKAQASEFLASIKAAVAHNIDGMRDDALLQKNEKASQLLGRDTSNAAVIQLMASHILYHLGSCDAALRDQGLEGAF